MPVHGDCVKYIYKVPGVYKSSMKNLIGKEFRIKSWSVESP